MRRITRVARPCYDKHWRCPGWAGSGWNWAETDTCPNEGYAPQHRRFSKGPWICPKCRTLVLPYWIRRLDPTHWGHRFNSWKFALERWKEREE